MGQICHHFGWSLDYLLWDIDWRIVQRMLIDAPKYESKDDNDDDKKSNTKSVKMTEQNSEDLIAQLQQYK
ncbi:MULTISPECIES: hypothetical protein [unclassified Chryseobacterium]|uniref:hypothetical protein n=1 Tax=unclassified Chryseobacterium TaxID=2593645 RepID=UPI0028535EC3|nr:hypothetical protein [Chryseobacterium sp. CFS7]MDR4892274.1 hypothetical protein [Chryseobacterium sp. CFS7]